MRKQGSKEIGMWESYHWNPGVLPLDAKLRLLSARFPINHSDICASHFLLACPLPSDLFSGAKLGVGTPFAQTASSEKLGVKVW